MSINCKVIIPKDRSKPSILTVPLISHKGEALYHRGNGQLFYYSPTSVPTECNHNWVTEELTEMEPFVYNPPYQVEYCSECYTVDSLIYEGL